MFQIRDAQQEEKADMKTEHHSTVVVVLHQPIEVTSEKKIPALPPLVSPGSAGLNAQSTFS